MGSVGWMTDRPGTEVIALPVNDTLRWITVGYRLLTWIWIWIIVGVVVIGGRPGNRMILATGVVVATVWLGVTLWASRSNQRLGRIGFVIADGVVALALSATGWLAGVSDFVSGGWPGSWLFVVAFATDLSWTIGASLVLVAEHTTLHLLHGLSPLRTAGTFQFVALALVVGWAFDALRQRERLRIEAEQELAKEQQDLARHQERSRLALQLHDSVLQTLHAIRVGADSADEVRYLSRRQERELRRTIEEFRSPYPDSFRARLLRHRNEVEDLCRGVQIIDVIRDDAPLTSKLNTALHAAREAMLNAGKHAGVRQIDLYSEISGDEAVIHVRDRGAGFDVTDVAGGMGMSVLQSVERAGGQVLITSESGQGTEVTIRMPSS